MTDEQLTKHMLFERLGISQRAYDLHAKLAAPAISAQGRGNEIELFGPIVGDEEATFLREVLGENTPVISPSDFRQQLDAIQGDVCLRVNSPGGSVFDAAAIRSFIVDRQAEGYEVNAVVSGIAASAAAILLTAANRVTIYPASMIMIHQASAVAGGNSQDLMSAANALVKVDDTQTEFFAQRMDLPNEEVYELLRAETYFTAEEAVQTGLADAVVTAQRDDDEDDDKKLESEDAPQAVAADTVDIVAEAHDIVDKILADDTILGEQHIPDPDGCEDEDAVELPRGVSYARLLRRYEG